MKKCTKCQETKELTEFKLRTDGYRNSWCQECKNTHNKVYWENNSDKIKAINDRWNNRISGVYAIYGNDECLYVGESKGVPKRLAQHKCNVNNPSLTSKADQPLYYKLQQHSNLEFKILEETLDHKERETFWINKLKPKYNAQKIQ